EVRVVATEPEGCASLHAARDAGGPTVVEVGGVAASSLGAESIGEYAWHANRWIDDSVLVKDAEIIAAQTWIWQNVRLAVEPAAATTVAALMSGVYRPEPGEHVVALISGANVNPGTLG
ncbi:MAG: pyridoxal-phosphate dependent enzyme, partial [Acidimicrobiia bacterium]